MGSEPVAGEHRWVGQSLARKEDRSLLTGAARFMPDLAGPGTLHVGFVRSTVAHADLVSVDTERARAVVGILTVVTHGDLPDELPSQPSTHNLGTRPTPYYALARDRVRYVGEAVAAVVGESETAVYDAMEQVEVRYHERPVIVDAVAALTTDSPVMFDGWPDNVAGAFEAEMGDVDAALETADVVITRRLGVQRQTACSMEGRGALAEWDPHREELTLWTSTQSPHIVRDFVAEVTRLPTNRIIVRVPAVGGAFGGKFHYYP